MWSRKLNKKLRRREKRGKRSGERRKIKGGITINKCKKMKLK
jgi:hypothetical protein